MNQKRELRSMRLWGLLLLILGGPAGCGTVMLFDPVNSDAFIIGALMPMGAGLVLLVTSRLFH